MRRHKQLLRESTNRKALLGEARVIRGVMRPYVRSRRRNVDETLKMAMCEARVLVENGYKMQLVEAGLIPVLMSIAKLATSSGGGNVSKEEEEESKSILGSAGEGAVGMLEGLIARNIAEMLGADEEWADIIGIALSKMDMFDIPRLITDCEFTADIIFDVALEYGMRKLGKLISSDGESGLFDELIVAMLSEVASDAEIVRTIKGKIGGFVCDKFDSFVDTVIDSIS